MILVSYMISQDHVTNGWSKMLGGRPSWEVTNLLILVARGTALEIE